MTLKLKHLDVTLPYRRIAKLFMHVDTFTIYRCAFMLLLNRRLEQLQGTYIFLLIRHKNTNALLLANQVPLIYWGFGISKFVFTAICTTMPCINPDWREEKYPERFLRATGGMDRHTFARGVHVQFRFPRGHHLAGMF